MSSEDLEAIRRRHAAPTSGPWDTSRGTLSGYVTQARADVLALLADVARLERERDEAREKVAWNAEHVSEVVVLERDRRLAAEAALAVAREREQRLRDALAFYANQPNAHGTYSDVLEDGGDRARAALVDEPAAASAPDPATLSVTQGGIGDTAGFFLPPAAADEPGETP